MIIYTGSVYPTRNGAYLNAPLPIIDKLKRKSKPPHGRRRYYLIKRSDLQALHDDVLKQSLYGVQRFHFPLDANFVEQVAEKLSKLLSENTERRTFKIKF